MGCRKSFNNEQGRGSHERECVLAKLKHSGQIKAEKLNNNTIDETNPASASITHLPTKQLSAAEYEKGTSRPMHNIILISEPSKEEKSKDGRR